MLSAHNLVNTITIIRLNVNFKKRILVKGHAQFTTVTFIMKKVSKQGEQVNSLKMELKGYYM